MIPTAAQPSAETEDIFAGMPESSQGAGGPTEFVPPIGERATRGGMEKLIIVIGAVVLLAIVGVVAWLTFFRGEEQLAAPLALPAPAVSPEAPTPAPTPASAPTAPTPEAPPAPPVEAPLADTDGDGIPDAEEAQLGTDPRSADTDRDGLSDRDEVRVYLTNPRNPDTDGDRFTDGAEVRNGYNPKGPGRLFEVPPAG